jgi:hypothetical protein
MLHNTITYYDANGKELFKQTVLSLKTEPGRSLILRTFAQDGNIAYFETNVRRYTSGDIYGNHAGIMI